MARPTPQTPTRDSSGNQRSDNQTAASENAARGQVMMADGSVPAEMVQFYADCGAVHKLIAVADSKGRFGFNPDVVSGMSNANGCVLRASLEGYRSQNKPLADVNSSSKLGKITLQPIASDTNGLTTGTDAQASKNAKKAYDKGLDAAAKQDWSGAMASFQKAISAYADYSSAWLSLGVLQQSGGDVGAAEKSFTESAHADGKFALPLIRLAALNAARGDWQQAVDYSQKAIDLNPAAFPHAYELNAMGNMNLQKMDAAEKSATEGLKVDAEHQYPELEYALGIVLKHKHEAEGAKKHLQAYIDESPNGPNVATAKSELAELGTAPQ